MSINPCVLRRLAMLLAAAAVFGLASCGGTYSRTEVERRNEGFTEYIPEDKATRQEPFVRADLVPETGLLKLAFSREIEGPVWRAPSHVEETTLVHGTNPDLAKLILVDTLTLGIPILMAPFDEKVRNEQLKMLAGERNRSSATQRTVVDLANGRPTERTETRKGPWPNAPFAVRMGTARLEGRADAAGSAQVRLTEVLGRSEAPLAVIDEAVTVEAAIGPRVQQQVVDLDTPIRARLLTELGQSLTDQGSKMAAARQFRDSASLFRRAAEIGHARGQHLYGLAFWNGEGVPKNDAEARHWLERAANQGVPEAQLALAVSLAGGETATPTPAAAKPVYFWANLAAATLADGRDKAIRLRDRAAHVLPPREVAELQAETVRWQPRPEAERLLAEAPRPPAAEPRPVTADASAPPMPPPDPDRLKGRPNPDAVALVIGIDQHETLPRAEFAEADARSFRGFAVNALGMRPDRVKTLIGREARRLDVEKALHTWLKAEIDPGRTDVVLYFSGHGLASEDGQDLFLMPHDGDRVLLDHSALSRRRLVAAIQAMRPRSLLLLLDTCYSGGTRSAETLLASVRPVMLVAREDATPQGVAVLSAAANDQLSASLPAAGHGLFSYFLMKGLEGAADRNGDRRITLGELHEFVADRVPREAIRLGRTQQPQLAGDGGKVIATW